MSPHDVTSQCLLTMSRRNVSSRCHVAMSPHDVTSQCLLTMSRRNVSSRCHQAVSSRCYITLSCHAVISRCLVTLLHHAVSSRSLVTLLYHALLSRCYITLSCHAVISRCLVTLSCHAVISRSLVTLLYHALLSRCYITLSCHAIISRCLVTLLYHTHLVSLSRRHVSDLDIVTTLSGGVSLSRMMTSVDECRELLGILNATQKLSLYIGTGRLHKSRKVPTCPHTTTRVPCRVPVLRPLHWLCGPDIHSAQCVVSFWSKRLFELDIAVSVHYVVLYQVIHISLRLSSVVVSEQEM